MNDVHRSAQHLREGRQVFVGDKYAQAKHVFKLTWVWELIRIPPLCSCPITRGSPLCMRRDREVQREYFRSAREMLDADEEEKIRLPNDDGDQEMFARAHARIGIQGWRETK